MNILRWLATLLPWRWKSAKDRERIELLPRIPGACICAPGSGADPKCPQHGKEA